MFNLPRIQPARAARPRSRSQLKWPSSRHEVMEILQAECSVVLADQANSRCGRVPKSEVSSSHQLIDNRSYLRLPIASFVWNTPERKKHEHIHNIHVIHVAPALCTWYDACCDGGSTVRPNRFWRTGVLYPTLSLEYDLCVFGSRVHFPRRSVCHEAQKNQMCISSLQLLKRVSHLACTGTLHYYCSGRRTNTR